MIEFVKILWHLDQRGVFKIFSRLVAGKPKISYQNDSGGHKRNIHLLDPRIWMIFSGQAGAYIYIYGQCLIFCYILIIFLHTLVMYLGVVLSISAILGFCGNLALAEDESAKSKPGGNMEESGDSGLERVEDGSVVSNIHTSKWRVFTDSGRDHFFQVG